MEITTQPPVSFTESAITELKRLLNEPQAGPQKHLRIGVKGGGCSGLSYVLGFEPKDEQDNEYRYEGLPFIVNKAHEMYLYGMQVDWQGGLNSRGFTFQNPNASKTCGCGTSFSV